MWRRNQKNMTKRDCKSTVGLEQGSSGIEAFKDSSNCHLKLRRTWLLLIMMVMMIVGDDYYFSYLLSKIRKLHISVFFFLLFSNIPKRQIALYLPCPCRQLVGQLTSPLTFVNIYRHKSPLLTQYHSLPISTKLY